MPIKEFKKYHKEDTSYATKKEAVREAIKTLKACEGFMLFTAHHNGEEIKYNGNAFIDKNHAAGMPEFINMVLNRRKI